MSVEPTVSLGNIITALISIGAVVVASVKIVGKLGQMEMKLEMVWRWFEREHRLNGKDKRKNE